MAEKTYMVEVDGQKVADNLPIKEAMAELNHHKTGGKVQKRLDLVEVTERGTKSVERYEMQLVRKWYIRGPRKGDRAEAKKPGKGK